MYKILIVIEYKSYRGQSLCKILEFKGNNTYQISLTSRNNLWFASREARLYFFENLLYISKPSSAKLYINYFISPT
jgi:hypothetical protein